jgi:hypothetical protein
MTYADTTGDPFGAAAEYAARDTGTPRQLSFADISPTLDDILRWQARDDAAAIARHRLRERFAATTLVEGQ